MNQLFRLWIVVTLLFMVGCNKENDDPVNKLESQAQKLEQLCRQMNTNISSLQTIVTALQNNDCITNVTPIAENNTTIGYTITFAKASSITIYHGKNSSNIPTISVKQDTDDIYYWTLDGKWLLDNAGNKIKVQGLDDKDGDDSITPQIKIENGYWYVSCNNGASWTQLGKATDSTDGNNGVDGKSFFKDVTQDENNVYFTLADNTVITVSKRLGIKIDPSQIPDNEIWYVMSDGTIYDVYQLTIMYGHRPFDATIISNTYKNGYGIIRFDVPVKKINDRTFGWWYGYFWAENMTELYLPDCIEYIGAGAIQNTGLTTLRIPKNLKYVGANGLSHNSNLESFSGEHVSEDGKCVIIDGSLCGFAPKGIKEYTIPEGVKEIKEGTFSESEIENVTFPEGLEYIEGAAFAECELLKSITLPSTLKGLHPYAFLYCTSIEGFYGNEKFHTSDHKCLIVPASRGKRICGFAGHGLSEYTIPEGIVGIENYAFQSGSELQQVTLPSTITEVAEYAFNKCSNLEAIYGEKTSADHRCVVFDGHLRCLAARKGVPSTYKIPDNITSIGSGAFIECSEIEAITMGDQVTKIEGYAFSSCTNLRSITLSAGLKDLSGYDAFSSCHNLETIYCRALVPPSYHDTQMTDFTKLKFYVPEQSLALYQNNPSWSSYRKYFVGYKYTDLENSDFYVSSDFSKDGTVTTLQTATKGNGINIVLMGDAYSDRQIANGTYKTDMEYIYNNLFTEEPYKSFKDHFNVSYVNVVSSTEGYEHGGTSLGGYFGNGTRVGGNDGAVFDYALKAISEKKMDEALLIVAMNSDNYAGTCYYYDPESVTGTYGSGVSVAYFPRGGDAATFAQLLHHEACGHGFAKLADEYAYEGAAPSIYIADIMSQQSRWGWWKNVDFTNDPTAIRWSHFINDTRYANEGLGAFEGGLTYSTGVWRPTENSIMRYNTGGFNAPSREAIYYRIHKLAYGDSWNYDYEKFVEWDARNRATATTRAMVYKPTKYKPTHAPVIVKKSWKNAR